MLKSMVNGMLSNHGMAGPTINHNKYNMLGSIEYHSIANGRHMYITKYGK